MIVGWIVGARVFLWSARRPLGNAEWDAMYRLGLHFQAIE